VSRAVSATAAIDKDFDLIAGITGQEIHRLQ